MEFHETDVRDFIESLSNVDARTKVDFYRSLLETIRLGQKIEADSGVPFKGFVVSYLAKFQ